MIPNLFEQPFEPDYGVSPGTTLREVLERLGLSQSDLAGRTGRPKKTINEIIQGKTAITPETALQFERVLGISASFWLNLERLYQAAEARRREGAHLAEHLSWLEKIPVKEIAQRGWIRLYSDPIEQLREVLSFFGVAYPEAWNDVWREERKAVAFRQTKSRRVDFGVVAVWLRKGEIEGRARDCQPFDASSFREALAQVRAVTNLPADQFAAELQQRCALAGVAIVFVRELPRLGIFGAARWLSPEKALIQLSLHYKREDQLIFSFFHEAGHVLLHGRREVFVDFAGSADDRQEVEANRFAADLLIPPRAYARFIAGRNFSESAVLRFARELGIAPGIVVGRLQHEKEIAFDRLTHMLRKVDWSPAGKVMRV